MLRAETAILELYDYAADPEETKNLAGEQPEVVTRLRALLAKQPEAKPQVSAAGAPPPTKQKQKQKQKVQTSAELRNPATAGAPGSTASAKPDILVILADDLGWADVGWHGSEIKTPVLDKLAKAGARLEQFYVLPVCSPTRAALMTGRYPMRHGLQSGVVRPWAQYGLPLAERTLPQALKESGYATAICGKWHLGHFQNAYLPTRRGFDHQYGHYNGALDYFTHIRDGGFDWHRDDRVCRDEGYTTFLVANEAARLIREQPRNKPLFLYVPFNAVHAPHQVPEKYTAPYRLSRSRGALTRGCWRPWMKPSGRSLRRSTRRGGVKTR